MRRTRFFFCVAVVFASTAMRAAAISTSSSAEGSIEGRAAARAFVEYLSPKMCAVVLERQRCRSDFQRLRFALDPAQLSAVARWLADGNVRHRLRVYTAYVPPDALWANDATFAWWLNATAETMLADAGGAPIQTYRATLARILNAERSSSPPDVAAPVDVAAVDRIAPIDAVPSVADLDRPARSMQTGVYAETLAELLDSPSALALPDGRAFALQVVDREEAYDRTFGDHYSFGGIRAILRGKIPNDPATIDAELRRPLAAWERVLHKDRVRSHSFLFGVVVTRIAYDASVLRDRKIDRKLRTFARKLRFAHAPSVRARRAARALLKLPIGVANWVAIRTAAENAVVAIVSSGDAPARAAP